MAKNIVIAEGGTAKNFTAKKLQTNLQGSGRVNWIPEDEAVDYVNLKDHIFHEAGTFNPSDFNCDGFRQVKIDIPADVKPKTITANGEFYAADDNCLGYSKVTVAVPGGGGGGPYTVRFFDDDHQTILKTDANVPYGGSASCTALDGTIIGGQYFKGWNPSPTGVKEDMNCYPMRSDYIIDPNQIEDSWETICADGGAHYPLGSYKALVVYDLGGNYINYYSETKNAKCRLQLDMIKVAEGEENTTSTWLSTGLIYFTEDLGGGYYASTEGYYASYLKSGWRRTNLRHFLNQSFLSGLPTTLFETIKPVTRYSRDWVDDGYSSILNDMETYDKIWVPSDREWKTVIEANGQSMQFTPAHWGVDYSSVYVPTYSPYIERILTRDIIVTGGEMSYMNIGRNTSNWAFDNMCYCYQARAGVPFGFCL